jgi:hypothetical protein
VRDYLEDTEVLLESGGRYLRLTWRVWQPFCGVGAPPLLESYLEDIAAFQ